jgi:DNA-binding GntR family transcriptional regulator
MKVDVRDGGESARPLLVATKAEAAFRELRARILDGSLEPGSTVNQEAIASSLGLSITPVREALRRLDTEGLVRLEAHRTVTVAPLSVTEVQELYAVRLRLDPFAASLAAAHASDGQLDAIEALSAGETEPTTRGRLAANRRFHARIYRSARNATLAELLDRLWDQTDRYRLLALQDEAHERTAEREHQAIAGALRARDGERAAELMRSHVEATLRLVERHAELVKGEDG